MKILYTNVIEQNTGWGAEFFVNHGFLKNGHETYCIDFHNQKYHLVESFLKSPECDVFFLQRGDKFPIPILKAIQLPRFFWASELVSRCRDQDRLLKSGLFDHIFVHTRDCLETIVGNGWVERNKLSVLLNGFDETVFKPDPSLKKDIDILFVGTITPRRKLFLEEIRKQYNLKIVSAFGKEMSEWINRSKIVLNIHAEDYLDTETRVFEALGCGGFLLSERLSVDNPFINNEFIQFDSLEDCIEKIDIYLDDQNARDIIANNGYLNAIRNHTYTIRAAQIAEILVTYISDVRRVDRQIDKSKLKLFRQWEVFNYRLIVPVNNLLRKTYRKVKSFKKKKSN